MLHALAKEHSDREIWWLHGARSSRDHSFAAEARTLLASLPNVHAHVYYSRPDPNDLKGRDFDSAGRLTASLLAELEPPRDAEAYLCGPAPFMDEISAGLAAIGLDASRIHTEPFGPAPGLTPGIAATTARTPHPPAGRARNRPDDRVRPQQPRRPLERRLREPARARRGMRRTRPLVVPHRRLPQLRDHPDRRHRRLQPRPGRTTRRGKRTHLLLTAARRRSARSVTSPEKGQGLSLVAANSQRSSFSCTLVAELTGCCHSLFCLAAADATGDSRAAAPDGGAVNCSADDEQAERREQGQEVTSAVCDAGERVASHGFRQLRGGVVHFE